MAITTPQGIDLQAPEALELKTIKASIAERDAISLVTRYVGLKVFTEDTGLNYQLKGGIQNSDWVQFGDPLDFSLFYTKVELQTSGQSMVHWDNITNTPTEYPPSAHSHVEADITDLQNYLLDITSESLTDLSDVAIVTPLDNQTLTYVSGSWVNQSPGTPTVAWGNITGVLLNQFDLQNELNNKKNNFIEGSAFNKNFGIVAGTVSEGNHTHTESDITDLDKYTQTYINNLISLYYTKVNLQTSGQSQVHWNNITNVPSFTTRFSDLLDTPPDYIGSAGKSAVVNSAETGLEFITPANTLLDLTDTPASYTGLAGQTLLVNQTEDGIEISPTVWEVISGYLLEPVDKTNSLMRLSSSFSSESGLFVHNTDSNGRSGIYLQGDGVSTDLRGDGLWLSRIGTTDTNSEIRYRGNALVATDTILYLAGGDHIEFNVNGSADGSSPMSTVLQIEQDGTLSSLVTSYEALVLGNNDIPNKKYVDDSITNNTVTFTDLTDTPANYIAQAGNIVAVNDGQSGLKFIPDLMHTQNTDYIILKNDPASLSFNISGGTTTTIPINPDDNIINIQFDANATKYVDIVQSSVGVFTGIDIYEDGALIYSSTITYGSISVVSGISTGYLLDYPVQLIDTKTYKIVFTTNGSSFLGDFTSKLDYNENAVPFIFVPNYSLFWNETTLQTRTDYVVTQTLRFANAASVDTSNSEVNITGTNLLFNGTAFISGKWSQSGSDIYYNSGNVGIGTNIPDAPLHIQKGSIGTVPTSAFATLILESSSPISNDLVLLTPNTGRARIVFGDVDDIDVGSIAYDHSLNKISLYTGALSPARMTITPSGYIGIATDNPSSSICFGATTAIIGMDTNDGSDNKKLVLASNPVASPTRGAGIVISGNESLGIEGELRLFAGNDIASGGILMQTQELTRLYIAYGGNVGIGTTTPIEKLVIAGGVNAGGIEFLPGQTATYSSIQSYDRAASNYKGLFLKTGTAPLGLYIEINGNVGIGTTAPKSTLSFGYTTNIIGVDTVGGADNKRIIVAANDVGSSTRGAGIVLYGNEYVGAEGSLRLFAGNGAADGAVWIQTQGITRIYASYGGNVGIGTTSPAEKLHVVGNIQGTGVYGTTTPNAANVYVNGNGLLARSTSSIKIKSNIKYAVDPNLTLSLQPVTFNEKTTGNPFIGFIAEEVNAVDSRLATNQLEKGLMGLDMNAIVASLVSTVQAQDKKIKLLETEIQAIKLVLNI